MNGSSSRTFAAPTGNTHASPSRSTEPRSKRRTSRSSPEVRLEQRLVAGDDGDPARRQRLDRLGVGARDVGHGADELEVLRADGRDERERRPRDLAELRDLPEPAHAHLGDEHPCLRLEPEHGERQAELVVPARVRGDGRRHRRAQSARARPSSSSSRSSRPRRRPGRPSGRARGGRVRRARPPGRAARASPRPAASASSTYRTPVLRATKRSPGRASRESSCTRRTTPSAGRPRSSPSSSASISLHASGNHARAPRPPKTLASIPHERCQPALPRERSAPRATSRSSKGCTTPAISCPCSCPLPAITTTSPAPAAPDRRLDRGAAVEVDLDVRPGPLEDRLDDRERLLGARVVARHDDRCPRARARPDP